MLVEPEPLSVRPARPEPRVWVRRWALWANGELIREVPLERGLNIVWSEDVPPTGGERGPPGHAAGKTLFVQLLRYSMLGATLPDELRRELTSGFTEPRVVAQLVVDGTDMVVVREVVNPTSGAVLQDRAFGLGATVALNRHSLPALQTHLRATVGLTDGPWPGLLDLLFREQRTRLEDVAQWRVTDRRDASARHRQLLSALNLFSRAEWETAQRSKRQKEERKSSRREQAERRVLIRDRRSRLRQTLDVHVGDEAGDAFVAEALLHAAEEMLASAESATSRLDDARSTLKAAEWSLNVADTELAALHARMEQIEQTITLYRESEGRSSARLEKLSETRLSTPPEVCPLCLRRHDNAESMAGATRLLDEQMDSARSERDRWVEVIAIQQAELSRVQAEVQERKKSRGRLVTDVGRAELDVRREEMRDRTRLAAARMTHTEAVEHKRLVTEAPTSAAPMSTFRPSLSEEAEVADRRRAFARRYAAVVRSVIGGAARGHIEFTGNQVVVKIGWDGYKESPAYGVMGILTFDLACMIARAEGVAPGLPFVVHDSPREADMSSDVYHGYFRTLALLEGQGGFFQSIVTTTSAPPPEFGDHVRLRLRGSPNDRRLLGRAL